MRTRVETLLGVDCRQMWISTFHALCARLLRREAPHIGLSRDFVIYDSTDQLTVDEAGAAASCGIDDSRCSRGWCCRGSATPRTGWKGPETFTAELVEPARAAASASCTRCTSKALKDANALDFDDLLLQDGGAVREVRAASASATASKFRYVMVDEYQDTNRPQYLLIQRLAAAHRNLVRRRRSRTSRSTSGAAPTCGTSSTSSTTFPRR